MQAIFLIVLISEVCYVGHSMSGLVGMIERAMAGC